MPLAKTTLHASCVALNQRAVLFLGPSGSGKSAMCLQLMGMGATLVADDKVMLKSTDAGLLARAPKPTTGMIEARGVGILAAKTSVGRVVLVVDLSSVETDRLPPERNHILLGHRLPLLHKVKAAYFPAAILQLLKGERSA